MVKSWKRKIIKPAHPDKAWWLIATWFGCGQSPIVSGTVASFAALPVAFVIHHYLGSMALVFAAFAAFFAGWWASNEYIKHIGGEDPHEIVIDEVAGQWLLLAALFPTWQSYLVGFILFRLFDIVKPWPINVADQKIHGGLGVMFDDMLAGIYPVLIYLIILLEAYMIGAYNLLHPVVNFLGGSYVH